MRLLLGPPELGQKEQLESKEAKFRIQLRIKNEFAVDRKRPLKETSERNLWETKQRWPPEKNALTPFTSPPSPSTPLSPREGDK